MNISFTYKQDSPRLLLIFAGWSTDATTFEGISCPGYDIAVVWDYSDLTLPEIGRYDEVVLLAWSLGVHAAELMLAGKDLPLTLTIAVNGTPTPVSDTAGIPEAIYLGTAEKLSEQTLAKFRRRMGASNLPRGYRSIDSLRQELQFLYQCRDARSVRPHNQPQTPFRWDRAIISDNDMIFPPRNQENAWQGHAEITHIPGPHTPRIQEIIDRFVINKTLVSSRFAKGRETYEDAADVQHRIADHLFSLWQKHGLSAASVLEIGVGNGYFTNLYSKKLRNSELILWDIAPAAEGVVQADAETQLPRFKGKVDAIASASTMQWFNSPAAFLQQCSRVLNPDGLAVLSTFGPKTFAELTAAGVIPLPYLGEESLRRIVPQEFEILELHGGLITKVFREPADVLKHLKATGVNARPCSKSVREIIESYPRRDDGRCGLTYQPIYLILRKK